MFLDFVNSECLNSTAPTELSILTASFSSVLLFITIPTNLLVCLAILIDPNKELRTQFNCFTFNLALADLLVGCVTEAICVYFHINESNDSEYGHKYHSEMQKVIHIPFLISAVASALSIAALALERYIAVTSPFRYRQYFDVKLSAILSMIIWVIALSFGFLNMVTNYMLQIFIFVNSVLLFTGFVVCFACFRIRATLRKVANNWAEIGMQSTRDDDMIIQKMLTKTFEIMIGALMCCYIPVCVMIYYMNFCDRCDCKVVQWFRDAVIWLILLNSAINPFIYALRNKSFRSAVGIIIRCNCRQQGRAMRLQERTASRVVFTKNKKTSYTPYKRLPEVSSRQTNYGSISTSSSYQQATIEV